MLPNNWLRCGGNYNKILCLGISCKILNINFERIKIVIKCFQAYCIIFYCSCLFSEMRLYIYESPFKLFFKEFENNILYEKFLLLKLKGKKYI